MKCFLEVKSKADAISFIMRVKKIMIGKQKTPREANNHGQMIDKSKSF